MVIALSATTTIAQVDTSRMDSVQTKLDLTSRLNVNIHSPDTLLSDELAKAEKKVDEWTRKADSLRSLGLPADKYKLKFDSLSTSLRNKMLSKTVGDSAMMKARSAVNNTSDSLMSVINRRHSELQRKIDRKRSVLDSLTDKAGYSRLNLNVPNAPAGLGDGKIGLNNQVSLPAADKMQLEGPDLPKFQPDAGKIQNPIGDVKSTTTGLTNKPNELIRESGALDEVNKIKENIGDVKEVAGKVETYSNEIKDVKENGAAHAEKITKDAEDRATQELMKQNAMQEVQKQDQNFRTSKNVLEQYKDLLTSIKSKEDAIDKGKDLAGQDLTKNFEGAEEKLKAGVAQLDKLKKKYKTIPDSRYLPKRAPNEMKGKSFRERIVPTLSLQVFKADRVAIDFQPGFAYKLSGRFRPGVSASWRSAVWLKKPWAQHDGIYGFRAFNDFRFYSQFYLHTEGEWLHFTDDAKKRYKFPADKDFEDWRTRFNVGFFRSYNINKRLNGSFHVLYNVLDFSKFPQNRNTSLRFGLEYKFKPKKPGK